MPDVLSEILAQADQIGKNRMWLPAPPNTGNTLKDFLLNALGTAPMALGAKMAPMATIGAMPKGALLKSDLGAPQVSRGMAENNNIYNPKVNDVLNYLSKRDLPIVGIKDPPGGTTYITTQNPTRPEGKNEIRVRVPEPGNEHPPRGDATFKFQQRNGPGSFFDVNPKGMTGSAGRMLKENESGGKYNDLDNLYAAIDKVTGRGLVEEGKGPILSKPVKPEVESPVTPDPNQLDLHALIDKTLGNMEQPKMSINEMKTQSRFASDPNPVMPEQGAQMQAANSVTTPRVNDPLLESMNKTDSGKYQLAIYKQELTKKGIDPKGMSLMDIYKELNPHLFEDR